MDSANHSRNRHSSRRWLLGFGVLALFGLLAWFAPAIVAHSPLWPRILAKLSSDLDGHVTANSIDLAWLAPIVVHDIVIDGTDRKGLARIESVRTESSLLELLMHRDQLGTIHVERPEIAVSLRPDGSNWEDALEPFWSRQASPARITGKLVIIDASVTIDGAGADSVTKVQAANVVIQLPTPAVESELLEPKYRYQPGHAAAIKEGKWKDYVAYPSSDRASELDHAGQLSVDTCTISHGQDRGQCSGHCSGKAYWDNDDAGITVSVAVRAESLPLRSVQTLLRRYVDDLHLSGQLTGDVGLEWNTSDEHLALDLRNVVVESPDLQASAWLGQDRLALKQLNVEGKCTVTGGLWQMTDTTIDCDAGHLQANGQFSWSPTEEGQLWQRVLAGLIGAEFELQGEVDLATVAGLLPRTLNVREDTQLESGKLLFSFRGQDRPDSHTWHVNAEVEATDLTARQQGRRIQWSHPFGLILDAEQNSNGWRLANLVCDTGFLQLAAQGTVNAGSVDVKCDLGQLADEVQQLIKVDSWQASGQLASNIKWERAANDQLAIEGGGSIEDLELGVGQRMWHEQQLSIWGSATGRFQGNQLASIEMAEATMEATRDRLTLKLAEPVGQLDFDAPWRFECEMQGEMANWSDRIGSLMPTDTDLAGPIELTATTRLSRQEIVIERAKLVCEPFRLSSPSVTINEPAIELQFDGRWDFNTGQWRIEDGAFRSSALAIRASDVGGSSPHMTGTISFRADLERLGQSWRLPGVATDWRATGQAEGQISMARLTDETTTRWSITLNDAQLSQWSPAAPNSYSTLPASQSNRWQTVWHEPNLNMTGAASYSQTDGAIQGQTGLSWTMADLLGVTVGPGRLQAKLASGIVRTEPIELSVSQGQLKIAPQLHVNVDPWILLVEPGQVLDGLHLTPEICRNWFRYLSPIAADAARADGRFSLVLDRCTIPIGNLQDAAVEGTLQIHEAGVGPGPLAKDLLQLAEQVKAILQRRLPGVGGSASTDSTQANWVTIPAQLVHFQLENGRVRHHQFEMKAGDVTLRSQGSIGLDQSLAIVIRVPIHDQWIQGDRNLAWLKGQMIEIPIGGTLENPRIDQRALAKLSENMVQNAAGRIIENELRRGLDQLFGPTR